MPALCHARSSTTINSRQHDQLTLMLAPASAFSRLHLHAHGADCSVPSTQVQEGDIVGELSLVANRPLWYSLWSFPLARAWR
jgi:hypothetical protein